MDSHVAMPALPPDMGVEAPATPLVVASVPSGHVYVRHLSHVDGSGPRRLRDPRPDGVTAESQQWWPPAMLEPGWVTSHDFDLLHLHFGFDARTPAQLEEWLTALRETGRPFIYTVHDLRNPHHESRQLHDEQLDVLVPAADQLITLTRGAVEEIGHRWGREAIVLPHPHVVPLDTMAHVARRPRDEETFVVGVHLKSLRASMDPLGVIETLTKTVADLPGAVLRVDAHRDVLEDGGKRFAPRVSRLLRCEAAAGRLDLRVHDYFSDDELWDYLASLDVSVLPYRFGTHSGWLEACRDLGTTVIAPTCGYFTDQGPVLSYVKDEDRFDAGSLIQAVRRAHSERPSWGASPEDRRKQRRGIALGHDLVYRAVLS